MRQLKSPSTPSSKLSHGQRGASTGWHGIIILTWLAAAVMAHAGMAVPTPRCTKLPMQRRIPAFQYPCGHPCGRRIPASHCPSGHPCGRRIPASHRPCGRPCGVAPPILTAHVDAHVGVASPLLTAYLGHPCGRRIPASHHPCGRPCGRRIPAPHRPCGHPQEQEKIRWEEQRKAMQEQAQLNRATGDYRAELRRP
jgi:hypothetical protein